MTSDRLTIEIDADFGSGTVTGVFEAFVEVDELSEEVRTGYLTDAGGDDILGQLFGLVEDGEPQNKSFIVGLGGGTHAISLTAQINSGETTTNDGTTLQWGSSSDPTVFDETTATGADAYQKAQIFQHYVRVASIDSLTPARIQWGEFAPNGVLDDHLKVAFEQPKMQRRGPDKYRFSAVFVEVFEDSLGLSAAKQSLW